MFRVARKSQGNFLSPEILITLSPLPLGRLLVLHRVTRLIQFHTHSLGTIHRVKRSHFLKKKKKRIEGKDGDKAQELNVITSYIRHH